MRNAFQVANYFIKKGLEDGNPVSPMKLQKLLFFAYGWYLSSKENYLFDEAIQAWKYGPVVESVYHATKHNKSDQIKNLIGTDADGNFSPHDPVPFLLEPDDAEITRFLDMIWATFSGYDAMTLSKATHSPDSPWTKVYHEYHQQIPAHTSIPASYIKEYFDSQRNGKAASK